MRGEFVFGSAAFALMAWPGSSARRPTRPGTPPARASSALLNATFGNLPEVVIVILAINAGLEDIARASIIGSVIGNILLILGLSLILGGWRNGIQTFNERVAGTNSSMLILGVAGLGIPTLFAALARPNVGAETCSPAGQAQLLLVCYGGLPRLHVQHAGPAARGRAGPAQWSRTQAVAVLAVTAVATGVVSELLVDSIKPTVEAAGRAAGVRRADPRPVRRERRRALLGRPARVPQPRRLLDGDRLRIGHPDRARWRAGSPCSRRSRSATSCRWSSTRSSSRRSAPPPCRHAGRPRRRDELARGPAAGRDLPDLSVAFWLLG